VVRGVETCAATLKISESISQRKSLQIFCGMLNSQRSANAFHVLFSGNEISSLIENVWHAIGYHCILQNRRVETRFLFSFRIRLDMKIEYQL
jgi:hypothetical protein